ncbi:hypothetical protein NEMIN01_0331 [Nematocida minor]|uniref:uncharacterized protein n=1 Tax=Nematocida minor TaxID=1912983 RepID=UPI0022207383|nr:uncharacterized protein NEMIN01_0331 [Nematocida minor]KAI5189165.1 hypothetical protein NEMIN01_0331 [Nematocida minor]
MKKASFALVSILVLICRLGLCDSNSQHKNVRILKDMQRSKVRAGGLPKIVPSALNIASSQVETSKPPVPMHVSVDNSTLEYVDATIEVEAKHFYRLAHSLPKKRFIDRYYTILIPAGESVAAEGLKQAFLPISDIKIHSIAYNENKNLLSVVFRWEDMQDYVKRIYEKYFFSKSIDFKDAELQSYSDILSSILKIKVIFRKEPLIIYDVNKECPKTGGLASAPLKISLKSSAKSPKNKKFRVGTSCSISEILADSVCFNVNCKNVLQKPVNVLHDMSSDKMIVDFWDLVASKVFANSELVSSIICNEFSKNSANKKYTDPELSAVDNVLGAPMPSLSSIARSFGNSAKKPLYRSPYVYVSKKDTAKSGYNLAAGSIIPSPILEKKFTLNLFGTSMLTENAYTVSVNMSSIVDSAQRSVFFNQESLKNLLVIVENLIASMLYDSNNWYAQKTFIGLTQVIKPAINYAIMHNENVAPLAEAVYYHVIHVMHNARKLKVLDPNAVGSLFEDINEVHQLENLGNKYYLEERIVRCEAFDFKFKRAILGCCCTSDYTISEGFGSVEVTETKQMVLETCWCAPIQEAVEQYCLAPEFTVTLPDSRCPGKKPSKDSKEVKKPTAAKKKSLSAAPSPSMFSATTRKSLSVVSIIGAVAGVVSVGSYYAFFR